MIDQQNTLDEVDKVEQERLAALASYHLLDTPDEIVFDRITRLVARVFATPAAVFNLITADCQWTKSSSDGSKFSLPRVHSFCAHTIQQHDVLVVPDVLQDPRFVDNPLVTPPDGIRFYAGAPIRTTAGAAIGSLCIFDIVPRILDDEQQAMLADFAAMMMDEIELRQQCVERKRAEQELAHQAEQLREQAQLLDLAHDAILVHDLRTARVRFWNQGAEAMYGYTKTEAQNVPSHELLQTQFSQPLPKILAKVLHVGQWQGEIVHRRRDGTEIIVTSHWTLQCDAHGSPTAILEINRDITERRHAERERIAHLEHERSTRLAAEAAQKRLVFLAEFGSAIATSLDLDTIIQTTARLVTQELADVCVIDLAEHGAVRRVAVETSATSTLAPDNFAMIRSSADGPIADVLSGKPAQLLITAPARVRKTNSENSEDGAEYLADTSVSAMILPLVARGRTLGTMSLVLEKQERHYTNTDLTMVEELAQRTAQAIDNAQLFCAIQAAVQHKDQAFALLDTLLATAPIGFAFLDCDLRYKLINHRLAEIGGISVAEHLGRTVRDVVPAIAEVIEPILQQVIATGKPVTDFNVNSPATDDHPEQHWLGTYYPVRAADGGLMGIGVIAAEITKIRQMESALSRSEAQLAGIINSAMDAIITVDEAQRVVLFNESAEKIFGCRAVDVVGQSLDQFIPERHIPSFGTTSVTSHIMSVPQTLSARRSDGDEFPIEASISQIEVSGQKLYTVILRDITERKRLEAQLLQSQKMESVGRLAGGVAHDFNNLLMGIMGYASLALRSVEAGTELHEDLSEVCKAADRAATLTHQLLAFARKQIIEPRIVNLNDLLLDIDKLLRRLIGADVELVMLPADRLRLVKVDPGQFQQLLVNLAVNARDAMPQGGRLTIETANVTISPVQAREHIGLAPGRYVTVSVSDTGVGMDEITKQHLFEPFFTTKESGKGTGLGLATCYGIVKQHDGYISADSAIGIGTTFTIYLPLASQLDADLPALVEREDLPRGRETVLLVEDEPAVRSLAARVLRQQGYVVLEATNGSEALRLVQTRPDVSIDLILTDVVMPQMGGNMLVNQLRTQQPSVKVLFMSGYPDRSFNQDSTIDFNLNFLQKPFLPGTLARKVRDVLEP